MFYNHPLSKPPVKTVRHRSNLFFVIYSTHLICNKIQLPALRKKCNLGVGEQDEIILIFSDELIVSS